MEEAESSIARYTDLMAQYEEWCEVLGTKIRRLESRPRPQPLPLPRNAPDANPDLALSDAKLPGTTPP